MKKLCIAIVCVACVSAFADMPPEPESEWEAGTGITGVGQISQIIPGPAVPNRRNLHYDSPYGDPEQTTFTVDTSGATDMDKKKYYYLTGDECSADIANYV